MTGTVRRERLESVLAERREVDREIDPTEKTPAKGSLPYEHGFARYGAGRT
jgi:hypothetical protein